MWPPKQGLSIMESSKPYNLPFDESLKHRVQNIKYVQALRRAMQESSVKGDGDVDVDVDVVVQQSPKVVATMRSLSPTEIETLVKSCNCTCDDWSTVFLLFFRRHDSDGRADCIVTALMSQIQNCSFSGHVLLGIDLNTDTDNQGQVDAADKGDPSLVVLKPGVHSNTMIADAIIEPGARVYNNVIISNTFIGSTATVLNCGSVTCCSSSSSDEKFCHWMTIDVGPEAGGGRPVDVMPESTLVDVCSKLSMSQSIIMSASGITSRDTCKCNDQELQIPSNIICGNVLHISIARNIYVASTASIKSSSSVSNAILLPQASIQNSIVDHVFLQWKASIVNNSNVSSTLLMECSEIGPNSVVASTVLGPDSHVSCGEVHCSVIGPNTNSHHQSLLISALWPTGRGNVGYGSNIGSNHTGRIPDQECTVGEGVFWGLGCVIKFPVDLTKSFYSVVAAGVQLPPQSVAMPFSLIMSGSRQPASQDMNEIVPGWLLQSSPYTILRSEEKFKKRRKATRHDFYCGWKIIRPTTVDACIEARSALLVVKESRMNSGEHSTSSPIFTEDDIPHLGKNYLTTRGLNVGINAYTAMIQRYALGGLLELLQESIGKPHAHDDSSSLEKVQNLFHQGVASWDEASKIVQGGVGWPVLPWEEESHNDPLNLLKHQMRVLALEILSVAGPGNASNGSFAQMCVKCLKKLISLETSHAKQVLKSKQRDDKRGKVTVPGYDMAHVKAEDDSVVRLAQSKAIEVVAECYKFIEKLSTLENRSRL